MPTQLTAPPDAPALNDPAAVFDSKAAALAAWFATFVSEMNTVGSEVASLVAAATALQGANFRGAWSALTGPLTVPASVAHNGRLWVLSADLADVTLDQPGVTSGSKWARNYPTQRIPILDAQTQALAPVSAGEVVHNVWADCTGIAASSGYMASNGNAFVVTSSASVSACSQSTDGRSWTSRAMPSAQTWYPVGCSGGVMLAFASSVLNGCARSTDNGATWVAQSLGGVTTASGVERLCAGHASTANAIVRGSTATQVIVSTNAGSSWTAVQTTPTTFTELFVLPSGTFVGRISTTLYRSTTGLTGSWTSAALPASTDTVYQDTDGSLLAYQAGNLGANVYRSTDAVAWTDLGWQRPTTGSPRSINGTYCICDNTYSYTLHGTEWVPRRLRQDFGSTARGLTKVGNVHVFCVSGSNRVAVYDHTAADARRASWE